MTHGDVICPIPDSRRLRQQTFDLLAAMAKRPIEITRSEARGFLRAIFGPAGLCYEPRGTGRRVFRLPTTNDALVLDYLEPVVPFEPSRVIARVHWKAVHIKFRPRRSLDRIARDWLQSILRLLGIGGRGAVA